MKTVKINYPGIKKRHKTHYWTKFRNSPSEATCRRLNIKKVAINENIVTCKDCLRKMVHRGQVWTNQVSKVRYKVAWTFATHFELMAMDGEFKGMLYNVKKRAFARTFSWG